VAPDLGENCRISTQLPHAHVEKSAKERGRLELHAEPPLATPRRRFSDCARTRNTQTTVDERTMVRPNASGGSCDTQSRLKTDSIRRFCGLSRVTQLNAFGTCLYAQVFGISYSVWCDTSRTTRMPIYRLETSIARATAPR
jgi:hypothetical protein